MSDDSCYLGKGMGSAKKLLFFWSFLGALSALPVGANAPTPPPGKPEKLSKAAEKFQGKVTCENLPQKTVDNLWAVSDCLFKMGASLKAVDTLREITRRNPKELEGYFLASWLLWNEGHSLGGDQEKKYSLEGLEELQKARIANPTHWQVDVEIGDYYLLRLNRPQKAYAEFLLARSHYDGDYSHNVPKAENGRRAAIEDRIARTTEGLAMNGAAVEASCRALFFDPDDKAAQERVKKLFGSCIKKGVKDPQKEEKIPASTED